MIVRAVGCLIPRLQDGVRPVLDEFQDLPIAIAARENGLFNARVLTDKIRLRPIGALDTVILLFEIRFHCGFLKSGLDQDRMRMLFAEEGELWRCDFLFLLEAFWE